MGKKGRTTKVFVALSIVLAALAGSSIDAVVVGVPAFGFQYVASSHFGSPGSQIGQLSEPLGIAIARSSGDVLVADPGNHRVDEFDSSGKFMAAWGWGVVDGAAHTEVCTVGCLTGVAGHGPGQFTRPLAIAVDDSGGVSQGDVYVADEANAVVEKFNSSGSYISTLSGGSGGPFNTVYGVAVDNRGDVWIYDSSAEVYEFSANGSELQQWNTGYGARPGFAVDQNDNVYAVRSCGCTEKLSSAGRDLGELDPSNENAMALAVDPLAKTLFSDQGTFVLKYDTVASSPTIPLGAFGGGALQDSTGVGVNSITSDVYVANTATDEIEVYGPPPPGPPVIERVAVANVDSSSVEMNAAIYTGQSDTTYRFEYGPTSSYGSRTPGNVDIGSGLEAVRVTATVTSLQPSAVYHYRVIAENSYGAVASTDQIFTTFPSASSELRPDERVYELVSPSDKNGGDIGFLENAYVQATPTGEQVTYRSLASFASPHSAGLFNQYFSKRTAEGWTTEALSPPAGSNFMPSFESPYQGFTPDLSAAVLAWRDPTLTPQAQIGYNNLYLRNLVNGSYRLITVQTPHNGSEARFVAGSSDFSHIVFNVGDALLVNAAAEAQNIYEWSEGVLSLVNIPPGSTTGSPNSGAGDGGNDTQGAVSSDGSMVFWTDNARQLYVWHAGSGSVKVNASLRAPSLGDGTATFIGAASDASHVLFSDETALTNAPGDDGGLYELDRTTGRLLNLTPSGGGSPGFQGVLGYNRDDSTVYFVATADLTGTAPVGQPNLYVSHDGTLTFIVTLSSQDSGDWAHEPASRHAAVSPDGTHAVFTSFAGLTGQENVDAITGQPDSQVFEYDAADDSLHCLSCNPSGEAPLGSSTVPAWLNASHNPAYLSADGSRVLFDSADSLTPRDINSKQDVYEWVRGGACGVTEGCVYLVSSGLDTTNSLFADASLSGEDIFFTTRARLAHADVDESIDLYDARVRGGFPETSPPAPCLGEACLGPLANPPSIQRPLPSPLLEGASVSPRFTLAPLGRGVGRRLAHTGKLTLHLRISGRGRLSAIVTRRIHGHPKYLASLSKTYERAGEVEFTLRLPQSARRQLLVHHRLRVMIELSFSGSDVQRLPVTFRDGLGRQ
jgi:hypothetical protein